MTDQAMIQRVDGALNMVRRGKVPVQQFALYVRKVTNTYLTEIDDQSLPSRHGELGEAPANWGDTADFTEADAAQLNGGDDMDAPDDHDIG